MKSWYLIPLSALAGLLAGTWGSSSDRAAEEAARAMRTVRADTGRRSGFRAIAELANIPERSRRPVGRRPVSTNSVPAAAAAEPAGTNAVGASPHPHHGMRMGWLRGRDLRSRIEEAQELWRTRCELVRTQWKSKLGADEAASARFDEALDAMNGSLRDLMEEFAEEVAAAKDVTPELGVKMMSAVTRTLSEGYDALGECVGEAKRGEISEMPIHEFIDPAVFEPMIQVQDYLEDAEQNPAAGRR